MMSDQPVPDLHDLHQVHLLAVGRRSRIFPHHQIAICEQAVPKALSQRWRALKHELDESSQPLITHDDSALGAE